MNNYQSTKRKYKKLDMSDATASKIRNLEVIHKLLLLGTFIIGIITIIDIFVPDPVFLLDEAALAAITGFFKTAATFTKKKIALLVETDSAKMSTEDVEELSKNIKNATKNIKRSRNK